MSDSASSLDKSVTQWIADWKAGDARASQQLWERFFQRVVGLARKRLGGMPKQMADEEDVAISAFNSFFAAAQAGRFPQLHDRDDLWQILFDLIDKKSTDLKRYLGREKRDFRRQQGESAFDGAAANSATGPAGFDAVEGPEPSPELIAEFTEEVAERLRVLDDPELRQIALWKLEGFENREIAEKLDRVERSVERKLKVIRDRWSPEASA